MRGIAGTDRVLPVYALGGSIVLIAGAHAVYDADPLPAEVLEAAILLTFGAATLVVAHRLDRRETTVAEARRVAVDGVLGGVGVGVLSGAFVAGRLLSGEPTTEVPYMLAIGWSVGVAAGTWTGFYIVRSEAALASQRDLAKRLTILQRVLRHNLRNEMSVVGGASGDLRSMVGADGDAAAKLDVIDRHVRAVMDLSERSQALTRIWQSEGDAAVDLGGVLADAIEHFEAAHPDVPLEADVPEGVAVRAQPRIGIAFEEALENAAEHNDDVEVTLRTRVGDDSVTAEVADTGSGVPETELRPLWASGEAPLSHTTGLGLWLIYWLVETSGGVLDVRSDDGGTTVSMTFERA